MAVLASAICSRARSPSLGSTPYPTYRRAKFFPYFSAKKTARDGVDRFSTLCQPAQRVPQCLRLRLLQRTIADLDATIQASHQAGTLRAIAGLSEKQHDSLTLLNSALRAANATQNKVEWIEVFIVSIYAAELVELFGHQFEFPRAYVGTVSIAAMLTAGIYALWKLRLWDEGGETRGAPEHSLPEGASAEHGKARRNGNPPPRLVRAIGLLLFLLACYLALGSWLARDGITAESAMQKAAAFARRFELRLDAEAKSRAARAGFWSACPIECQQDHPDAARKAREAEDAWSHADYDGAARFWNDAAARLQ